MPNLYVRSIDSNEVVETIPWNHTGRQHERALAGLLRNLDADRFLVDDSEIPT